MNETHKNNPIHFLDNKEGVAWSFLIGNLIINFGAVEFASFRWIEFLSTDDIMRDVAIDMQLSRRFALINRLIDRSKWPDARKSQAKQLWCEIKSLSKTRNKIAHNPIGFNDTPNGRVRGIINVKEMKGIGPYKFEPLVLEDVKVASDRLVELAEQLHNFL